MRDACRCGNKDPFAQTFNSPCVLFRNSAYHATPGMHLCVPGRKGGDVVLAHECGELGMSGASLCPFPSLPTVETSALPPATVTTGLVGSMCYKSVYFLCAALCHKAACSAARARLREACLHSGVIGCCVARLVPFVRVGLEDPLPSRKHVSLHCLNKLQFLLIYRL